MKGKLKRQHAYLVPTDIPLTIRALVHKSRLNLRYAYQMRIVKV